MALIFPFKAILYRASGDGDITSLVAPPYDVIGEADRAGYLARNGHNVVRLILPEGAHYAGAAALFTEWLSSGILAEDDRPAMYVWEQQFEHAGISYTRRALVCQVACGPYQEGGVLRHEYTQAGPKADRLALYQATGAQFSQIFGVFRDAGDEVTHLLAEGCEGPPLRQADAADGHHSRLYRISGEKTLAQLQGALAACSIVMADGHHRYETMGNYFEAAGTEGTALMTLVPDRDPGVTVLPTHRVAKLPLAPAELAEGLSTGYTIETHPGGRWPDLHHVQLAAEGPELLAVSLAHDSALRLVPTGEGGKPDVTGAVGLLHNDCLPRLNEAAPQKFDYHRAAPDAVEATVADGRWAFLLPPVSVDRLIAAAEGGAVFPSKSTYFFPKFLSGFISARIATR